MSEKVAGSGSSDGSVQLTAKNLSNKQAKIGSKSDRLTQLPPKTHLLKLGNKQSAILADSLGTPYGLSTYCRSLDNVVKATMRQYLSSYPKVYPPMPRWFWRYLLYLLWGCNGEWQLEGKPLQWEARQWEYPRGV